MIKWKCFVFIFFCQISINGFSESLQQPTFFFEHGIVSDYRCDEITGSAATRKKVLIDADRVTKKLQEKWDASGIDLLAALIKVVGREYPRKELTVYTTVCGSSSRSSPLTVNIKKYLDTIDSEGGDEKYDLAILVTLHEFIHKYLVDSFNYSASTVLLEFPDHPILFRNHLHVMALMKASMVEADREDLIDKHIAYIKGRAPYFRAWKFGTSKKYYSRILKEIRKQEGSNDEYWFFD